MNIVLATPQFLPDVYGGVETYTLGLATEFRSRGHKVLIACTRNSNLGVSSIRIMDDVIAEIPVRRFVTDPSSRPVKYGQVLYDPEIARHVGSTLDEWNANILHITNFPGISAAIIPEAKRRDIPIVWTATDFGMTCARYTLTKWDGSLCHGKASFEECLDCMRPRSGMSKRIYGPLSSLSPGAATFVARAASRLPVKTPGIIETIDVIGERLQILPPLIRKIDRIVAPSSWMKKVLVMNGADPEKIDISVYGLQKDKILKHRSNGNSHLKFAYLGRIHRMKGVDILVEAFNGLTNGNGATLNIYGSPAPDQYEYAGGIWALAKGNPGIAIGKQVKREDLSKTLEHIDVLVVPSVWYENSPIAILEALDHKVPVVASDVAGMSELIEHEGNGLLFGRGSVHELRGSLQRLVDNPSLVRKLSGQIEPIKSIGQDADILLGIYGELHGSATPA